MRNVETFSASHIFADCIILATIVTVVTYSAVELSETDIAEGVRNSWITR